MAPSPGVPAEVSRVVLLAVATLLLAAGCASGTGPQAAPTAPATTTSTIASTTAPTSAATTTTLFPTSTVAHARVPSVEVFEEPGQAEPVHTLANPIPPDNVDQLVFLVRERRPEWLKVLVPVRPNGTEGWIRASDVETFVHDFRIVVELGAHQITVYEGAEVFHQEAVGLGRDTTPTPGGLYYTLQLIPVAASQPEYGPYAYGLSGYSEVLYSFAGGDGQFGIHGTNNPAGLGTDVSNGCIRMSNEGITKLAETLPIGVPVEIRA